MRRHSLLSLFRRAFTLVELIIVIVIVGILAAISIVGYQSVVDRVDQAAAETTLQSVDREYRALAAFNIAADSTAGVPIADMTAIDGIDYTAGDTDSDGLLEPGETISFDGVVLTLSAATTVGSISGTAGTGADPPAPAPDEVELLLVAGGGGGGEAAWWGGGGGGGAGGMLEVSSVSISAGISYTVTVGEGGEGGTNWGAAGEDSVFASYTAIGGGFGAQGGNSPTSPATGGTGGSGGGSSSAGSYASGTAGQGNRGGVGDNAGNYTGGGGGGAGGVGLDAPNTSVGGAGGPGKSNSITGSPVTYASGGNGGAGWGGSAGANGSANSGNGGGGGAATLSGWLVGGNGGSGVAIIRFDDTKGIPTISAGLTYAVSSDNGDHVIQFTAGTGTITW